MKISIKRFVIIFVVTAFAFQFISNSLLSDQVELFPNDGEWYPGIGSPIAWKNTVGSVIYPVKYVLVEPLSFLGQDPDPVPPLLLVAFGTYWTAIALVLYCLYYFIHKIITRKKA
ncbi:MAG: hypothetical protein HC859_08665 [Bacteroidia bacterium]|nr:hypothetical protein [Bacteroidia bacterium]